MVVGYNHNIRYKGEVFHIQTEDSGRNNPCIVTLLYLGGTIISSKKTSYDDIIKIENLEQVIEELMKEQHKQMLLRLKAGEFDDRTLALTGKSQASPAKSVEQEPLPSPKQSPPKNSSSDSHPVLNLDDIILDYLAAKED